MRRRSFLGLFGAVPVASVSGRVVSGDTEKEDNKLYLSDIWENQSNIRQDLSEVVVVVHPEMTPFVSKNKNNS